MRITLSVHIDPSLLRPEYRLSDIHLTVADAFARILTEERLMEIESFDLNVEHDPDAAEIPPAALRWLKRFIRTSREDRRKSK